MLWNFVQVEVKAFITSHKRPEKRLYHLGVSKERRGRPHKLIRSLNPTPFRLSVCMNT